MIVYHPLFTTLRKKGLKQKDLQRMACISSATVAKMSRGESVTVAVLNKICKALKCKLEDVIEYEEDEIEG